MTRFATALVVGKFCPLHRGHQHVLDLARAQCAQLVVVSYTKPEFDGCGPETRARWLARLYPDAIRLVVDDAILAEHCARRGIDARALPHNDAADDVHRHFVGWLLHDVLQRDVDAVFTSETYGDGFAATLSGLQAKRGGPRVAHVLVDADRGVVPVSGTVLRADVHGLRRHLDAGVYRDFVRRVAILGGESTGKSTLCERLAAALGTVYAAEYGRELWEEKHGALTEGDMLQIARTQIEREEARALEARHWVLCDTTPLTTLLYSQVMFGRADEALEALARRPYDLVFLCAPDVPFMQDGTRRDADFRQFQHDWYLRELSARCIDYRLLRGGWEARRAEALHGIATHGAACGRR